MNETNHLAQNLRKYKDLRNLTMKELSEELDVPTATLRHIMNDGNTTLHTAIRISRNIGIGLDMLVSDNSFSDKIFIMDQMQRAGSWFAELSPEKKAKSARLMSEMWEVLSTEEELDGAGEDK